MNWLYISLSVIAGIYILFLIDGKRAGAANKKQLRDHPDDYCRRLKSNIEQVSPKMKVKMLQELFELAANGLKPAIAELWYLLDNYQLSGVHSNIIALLSQLGPAAVKAHASTIHIDDKGILYMAGIEGMESVYLSAGAVGLKRAISVIDKYHKGHKHGLFETALRIIAIKGNLDTAVKLLEEHDWLKIEDNHWFSVKYTIRDIIQAYPFPADKQLRFDYLWAKESYNISNQGMFGHGATYGGGTFAEIELKKQEELYEISIEKERIDSFYEKALNILSSDKEEAVEFFRKKCQSHLDYS